MVPIKSACFFCPASKMWELYWLAGHHPDLLERALVLERNALTGKHSRFDTIEFGTSWEDMVRNADRFPSTNTTVGLGRSFSWSASSASFSATRMRSAPARPSRTDRR